MGLGGGASILAFSSLQALVFGQQGCSAVASGADPLGVDECVNYFRILSVFYMLRLAYAAVGVGTRSNGIIFAKHILSRRAHRPMPCTTIRVCMLPSDAFVAKKTAKTSNHFSLSTATQGTMGVSVRMSCMNCATVSHALGCDSGGVNSVYLTPSKFVLRRAIVANGTPVTIARGSAAMCGSSTFHAPRNSVLRRLIGRLPKKRVATSNGLVVRKGRIGGVLISNGRFFSSSPRTTLGGLPIRVIRGLGTCRQGSSLTHLAKVSSNRRRVVLSLSIGGSVGGN